METDLFIVSPELVRNFLRYFLLWFWCCVPIAYIWTLFNINYFEGSETIFKNKSDIISYLRKNGDNIYNSASDDYLIDESFKQGYLDIDYYNNTGFYKLINNEGSE